MNLFVEMFTKKFKKLKEKGIKVVFSGIRDNLRKDVLESMDFITKETKDNTKMTLNICLNYGGQSEIVDASKKIATLVKNNELDIEDINEQTFYKYLYNDLPPIDLLIRTSGEVRISNYMLYSLSYAELVFTSTCFPDFDESEFDKCLEDYQSRNITKGGVK
jgi:undecaprenyl diphosphate synthase